MKFLIATLLAVTLPSVFSFGTGCTKLQKREEIVLPPPTELPVNLRVAFLGDAGNSGNQGKVLQLVKNWKADFVIHSGDFEYNDNPQQFENNLNAVLGANYPYFASIGNHDYLTWEGTGGHKDRLVKRLARFNATGNCVGDYGVNMACNYKGLYFVLSGVGTQGTNHANYINQAFTNYPAIWKFVSWHKNQRLMQIGGKPDETGWEVYDMARQHGAFIATGHEHSYCRSHLLSNFRNQVISSTSNTLKLSLGNSFAFVSGLAGKDIREWDETLRKNPWWAAYGATNNQINYGANLCIFNVNGDKRRADCVFQDINSRVWDQFTINSTLAANYEELLEQYEQKNKIEKKDLLLEEKCKNSFFEIPVSRSIGDVHEDSNTGKIDCHSEEIELGKGSTLFHFENVPLKKGQVVEHSNLQLFGIESDKSVQPSYTVTAFIGDSAKVSCSKKSQAFQIQSLQSPFSPLTWTQDVAEEWERSTIWVSEDFNSLINQVISSDDWQYGSTITLKVEGKGLQTIKTYDYSPCFGATLAFELEC